jgi:hypothetical protein
MERVPQTVVTYLPRVHAKVYVADNDFAVITSANFTNGGAFTNFEYGVAVEDSAMVRAVRADVERYASLGGAVSAQRLKEFSERVIALRDAIQAERHSINANLGSVANMLKIDAEEQLLRARVEGKSVFAIFGETILYLLSFGPMTTTELHERIRGIHPDICDDSLDRVIDGQHFGKLWKHQVRTAQQHLKRSNLIKYEPAQRRWSLV